ncbi:hypothetical protein M4I21_13550 [Cellulophaga sp. 20_2_10]|uniref:hypothetical protein n=1 Tax=Cellulophaga sp. 20_2_10 TaxID=2942476 RepID=UPI00201AFEB4|nr:hypothetical protein [Cellulophaga sp. 20_2_10]MCL5246843.1 hypothetical protein [Cellulophaga sp. 20_2_10]
MKKEIVLLDSPLYFECPVTGEVILDEENEISNEASSATEFIYYDGEFEFQKDWVKEAYEDDLIDFIQLESKDSKDIICYELVMGSGPSLDNLFIGIKN